MLLLVDSVCGSCVFPIVLWLMCVVVVCVVFVIIVYCVCWSLVVVVSVVCYLVFLGVC